MKIFSQIAYEKQGPFTEIRFNRPEVRNCIGPVTHAELIEAWVIDAQEAYRIGLVSEVVPKGRSLERAIKLGNVIAALPQPAIRTDKEATTRGFGLPLSE
jgi:enoyl-CoA hydratase/carnithine racemase